MISPFALQWSTPSPVPAPLPSGIERSYIEMPGGKLELLSAIPEKRQSKVTLFFMHGGFGSASVWLEYLDFFSKAGISCYAVSLRGHGNSYYPGFWRMVYGTSRRDLADDLVAGIKHVAAIEGTENICLVGHSSGGGLSQYILNEGDVKVTGLVLLGSVPGFGSLGVYKNWWFRIDPFSLPRMLVHLYHPGSPLSTIPLIRKVFFTSQKPEAEIIGHRKHMPGYESLMWAMSMLRKFVEPSRVLNSITGKRDRLLVLSGSQDKLCTPDIMRQMAAWYRSAAIASDKASAADADVNVDADGDANKAPTGLTSTDNAHGVLFQLEEGAPHHIQNDVQWRSSAQKILDFCGRLI